MIKQIVLQLDKERYELLVEALTCITDGPRSNYVKMNLVSYRERERVIAEQLKGLVITQWTGSRQKITASVEAELLSKVKPNYHSFVDSTNPDGTPNKKRCGVCHRSKKHWLHHPDEFESEGGRDTRLD